MWVSAYKNTWHVPWSSANSLYTCPTAEGGHEWPLTSGVLTQALLQHVDQCMRHEDVVKKSMLAQLARTLTEWHCKSFTDMIDELELWDWNVAHKDFWSRLTKSLHSQKVSVTWAGKMDQHDSHPSLNLPFRNFGNTQRKSMSSRRKESISWYQVYGITNPLAVSLKVVGKAYAQNLRMCTTRSTLDNMRRLWHQAGKTSTTTH